MRSFHQLIVANWRNLAASTGDNFGSCYHFWADDTKSLPGAMLVSRLSQVTLISKQLHKEYLRNE